MAKISTLTKNLDALFSKCTRLRDADIDGYGDCCSCGKHVYWKDGDAGHWQTRDSFATRFDERNVHLQCRACNRFKSGNPSGYAMFMLKKYGEEVMAEIVQLKRKITTPAMKRDFLEEKIQIYKEKLKGLQDGR